MLITELIYFSITVKKLFLTEDVRAIEERAILEEEVLNAIFSERQACTLCNAQSVLLVQVTFKENNLFHMFHSK